MFNPPKTETVVIGDKHYCYYCLNEAHEWAIDLYHSYFNCDCDGAKAEIEIQELKKRLEKRMKQNTEKYNKLMFESALKELQYKYHIKGDNSN